MDLGVLIVEDERDVRQYLTNAIPWNDHDMRVVAAVDDVSPALRIIEDHRVDLVLLDITLQQSDGLCLARTLAGHSPKPQIIIVTGHSEFEMVREALRLGVDDYLLKPFSRQELLMSVLSNREKLVERIHSSRKLNSLRAMMVEDWLDRLSQTTIEKEVLHVSDLLARHDVMLPAPPRVLMCTTIDMDGTTSDPTLRDRWLEHVAAVWRVTTEQERCVVWKGMSECVYLVFSGWDSSEVAWDAFDMAREFVALAGRRLPVTVRVGISGVDTEEHHLAVVRAQAESALRETSSTSPVVAWKPPMGVSAHPQDTWRSHRHYDVEGSANPNAAPRPTEHAVSSSAVSSSAVSSSAVSSSTASSSPMTSAMHDRYESARRFIEDYHQDPSLDVQTVAAHLGVSTEYLRCVFHAAEGCTCIRAITNRRIDHAKRLLSKTTISIAEVAGRAGSVIPPTLRGSSAGSWAYRRGSSELDENVASPGPDQRRGHHRNPPGFRHDRNGTNDRDASSRTGSKGPARCSTRRTASGNDRTQCGVRGKHVGGDEQPACCRSCGAIKRAFA